MIIKTAPKSSNWVVVKQNQETKICNFANNYYGDQQCYVVKGPKKSK